MGVNSLPKTVTRQHRGCDGLSVPESSTLTTRLPSHPRSPSLAASVSTNKAKLYVMYLEVVQSQS